MAEVQHIHARRLTRAGGFVLMTAGIIASVIGLALLVVPSAFGLSGLTGALLGSVVLVFAAVEFIGGIRAYQGQNFYGVVATAVLGLFTVVTLPLNLVAVILVILGEDEFDS